MFIIDRGRCERTSSLIRKPRWLLLGSVAVAIAQLIMQPQAMAAGEARSGKEVVETVCGACHGTGAKGAPKIGPLPIGRCCEGVCAHSPQFRTML